MAHFYTIIVEGGRTNRGERSKLGSTVDVELEIMCGHEVRKIFSERAVNFVKFAIILNNINITEFSFR